MTETDTPLSKAEETALDDFFSAARASRPAPGPDLIGRILTDAQSVSPAPATGFWARLKSGLEPVGGLAGLTGLTACAIFGISLGYGSSNLDGLLETVSLNSFDLDTAVSVFDVGGLAFDELEG